MIPYIHILQHFWLVFGGQNQQKRRFVTHIYRMILFWKKLTKITLRHFQYGGILKSTSTTAQLVKRIDVMQRLVLQWTWFEPHVPASHFLYSNKKARVHLPPLTAPFWSVPLIAWRPRRRRVCGNKLPILIISKTPSWTSPSRPRRSLPIKRNIMVKRKPIMVALPPIAKIVVIFSW